MKPLDGDSPVEAAQRDCVTPAKAVPEPDKRRFVEEATRLPIESAEKAFEAGINKKDRHHY